jgi:DNA-binding NtrC family response regulator
MIRVLVVEDDPDQLHMRRLMLEQAGYSVSTAQTADEALEKLEDCQVLLTDFRVPAPEDGLRLIEAASGSARIIVLSGTHPDVPLAVGEWLTKPCSSRKILETIERISSEPPLPG